MAEISFPFNADNEHGGSQVVSQTQWQEIANQSDGIDFHMTAPGASLPFGTSITNGRELRIFSGSARVGGFYYRNTGTVQFTVPDNASSHARKDLVVLRLDLARSAVNMAYRTGTAAASPAEPKPTRITGGVWEMPLHCIEVPAKQGAPVVSRRGPFHMPPAVGFPWNALLSAEAGPRNSFSLDLDDNLSGGQSEIFSGLDGVVVTRQLGKARSYTPAVVNVSSLPASYRSGRWRWIAPNQYWFTATVRNDNEKGAMVTGTNWRAGISLPQPALKGHIQVLQGYVSNPQRSGNMPNLMNITGTTAPGSTTLNLHVPSIKTPAGGLDGFLGFPGQSVFSISGIVESNALD